MVKQHLESRLSGHEQRMGRVPTTQRSREEAGMNLRDRWNRWLEGLAYPYYEEMRLRKRELAVKIKAIETMLREEKDG